MNRAQLSTTPTLTETYATMMYGTHRAEIAETIALIESYYDRPWIMSESTRRRASAAAERVPRYCFERSYVEGVLGLKAPIVESGVWPRDFEKRIIQEQLLMEGFFGDPDSKIRKSNPKAKKSFDARHNCDSPGPKTKARYWSCKEW